MAIGGGVTARLTLAVIFLATRGWHCHTQLSINDTLPEEDMSPSSIFSWYLELGSPRRKEVPALLKFTPFLTIVEVTLLQIPVTCGIIQSVSFSFEIQLSPQTKHVMPGHFSLISGSSYQFSPDRFLAPLYNRKTQEKSIFNSSPLWIKTFSFGCHSKSPNTRRTRIILQIMAGEGAENRILWNHFREDMKSPWGIY